MRILFCLLVFISSAATVKAQPPKVPLYSVVNVILPESMNKQVCISGMKYFKGNLYFASERCPIIFVFDPVSETITNSINLSVPQEFEMEGMTSYKDKLYLISENVAAVYEVNPKTSELRQIPTSVPLPPKSKSGDGTEGIAANEKNNKFYILRERNEDMTRSQIYTYSIEKDKDNSPVLLKYESTIELPLDNPQWRYSDICYDPDNNRLICLKSFAKGKLRQQYIESLDIDAKGNLSATSLKNIDVQNFSETSGIYKGQDYSMNLEGVTITPDGTIYIISDNTSGKAQCDRPAKEKTILFQLTKK